MKTSIISHVPTGDVEFIKEAVCFLSEGSEFHSKILIVSINIIDENLSEISFLMPDPFALYTLGKIVTGFKLQKGIQP